jgi:hypothetical protein
MPLLVRRQRMQVASGLAYLRRLFVDHAHCYVSFNFFLSHSNERQATKIHKFHDAFLLIA